MISFFGKLTKGEIYELFSSYLAFVDTVTYRLTGKAIFTFAMFTSSNITRVLTRFLKLRSIEVE